MRKILRRIFGSSAAKTVPVAPKIIQDNRARDQEGAQYSRALFLKESAAEVATTKEYVDWLERYFRAGGKISGVVPRNMGNNVLIARRDGHLPALRGTASLQLIVPDGVKIVTPSFAWDGSDNLGHNELFLQYGCTKPDAAYWVALYKDTVTELKHRGYSFEALSSHFEANTWHIGRDLKDLQDAFFEQPKLGKPSLKI